MRDILFKGKRLNNGEWIIGKVHVIDTYGKGYTGTAIQVQHGETRPYSVTVDPNTVCQLVWTDGTNKLWEGDALLMESEIIGIVKYENKNAEFIMSLHDGISLDNFNPSDFDKEPLSHSHVEELYKLRIGNIHDKENNNEY